MSRLRVSFVAGNFGLQPVDETVLGSCVWDTQAQTISDVSITSYGPYPIEPTVQSVQFSKSINNYPDGSLIFLEFTNAAGDVIFQLNYDDRSYTDPPIVPSPGFYFSVPFDMGGSAIGRNAPGTGAVIVAAEPAAKRPEPPHGVNVSVR